MKNFTIFLLSMVIVASYIIEVGMILTGKVDTTDPQKLLLIGNAIGGVQGMATAIVSYHFGSTKSSAEKDATISNMTKGEAK